MSSEPAALRLYAGEVSGLLVAELGSGQWGRKKAGAEAVVRLMQVGRGGAGRVCCWGLLGRGVCVWGLLGRGVDASRTQPNQAKLAERMQR